MIFSMESLIIQSPKQEESTLEITRRAYFDRMNLEEVKQSNPLADVVRKYGIKVNRYGMCQCPFHQDRGPSMKIYPDGHFHCFGCNAHGDVINFVAMHDGTDLKTAFLSLGGTYDTGSVNPHEATKKTEKQQQLRYLKDMRKEISWYRWRKVCDEIDRLQILPESKEPYSETWCQLMEAEMQRERIADELTGKNT